MLFILIPIGVLLNLFLGRYVFMISDANIDLYFSRNVLTIAIPSVLIGMLIRSYEHKLPSPKKIITALIVVAILLYAEQLILHFWFPYKAGDIIIFTLPVAILTFITFLRLNNITGKTMYKISRLGKRYTLDIYLWHPLIASIFVYIRSHAGIYSGMDALFVFVATLMVSIIVKPMSLLSRIKIFPKIHNLKILR